MLIQKTQRRKVKYDATTDPKCDSISLIRSSQGVRFTAIFPPSLFKYFHHWN